MAASPWHGNIETSTDTLVPNELIEEQICSELSAAVISDSNESTENGIDHFINSRSRVLPEVHTRSKPLLNGNASLMDDSILIQPEQQRMEIFNGNRLDYNQMSTPLPNGNSNGTTMPLYRRRRNSFNSKAPPSFVDMTTTANVRSDSISPNAMNSKFVLPSRTLSTPHPSIRTANSPPHVPTNISMISCPDGLAHALSEQNLRLQQIVHEHKVGTILSCLPRTQLAHR